MSLTPKNWQEFQHYSDRKPAWIKLHKALLDDYAFSCLPVASRALAPCLWLLASEYEGGEITASNAEIGFRLRMSEKDVGSALKPLIDAGFFIASEVLADCKQDAIPEKERQVEIQVEREARRKRRPPKVETELPADFVPDWQAAFDLGLTKIEAEREFQKFKNHAQMNARTAVRWNGAWANWCIKAAEFMGKSPPGAAAAPITEEEKQKLFAELRG